MKYDKGKFWDKGIQLVSGCNHVSPGCNNCWAEKAHIRFSQNLQNREVYDPDLLLNNKFTGHIKFNLRLLREALKCKRPRVFAIWNDFYNGHITFSQRLEAFQLIWAAKHHTFLIITKRPENAVSYLRKAPYSAFPNINNIWHIITAENQNTFNYRMPFLHKIPGPKGIIIEPMLSAINLSEHIMAAGIKQVILGAENGPGARPMEPGWARSVRAQCQTVGIPFYLKSMGPGRGRTLDGQEHNDLAWGKE